MFGIGMTELLVILAVALVVVGPKKLPEVARTLAKGLRDLRRASDDLKSTIMVDLDDPPPRSPTPPRALTPPGHDEASSHLDEGGENAAPATSGGLDDEEASAVEPAIHGSVAIRSPDGAVSRGDTHNAPLVDDEALHAGLETPDAKRAEALLADVKFPKPADVGAGKDDAPTS